MAKGRVRKCNCGTFVPRVKGDDTRLCASCLTAEDQEELPIKHLGLDRWEVSEIISRELGRIREIGIEDAEVRVLLDFSVATEANNRRILAQLRAFGVRPNDMGCNK